MASDFSTLEKIYNIFIPSDLAGIPENNIDQVDFDAGSAKIILRKLLDRPGGGSLIVKDTLRELQDFITNASNEDLINFHKTIRFYSTAGNLTSPGINYHLLHQNTDDQNKVEEFTGTFEQMIGYDLFAKSKLDKNVAIVLSDENFISPLTIAARDSELFLNFIPTHIMSRCVPYLNAEFVFDRPFIDKSRLNAPGMLKFLLGAQNIDKPAKDSFEEGSANDILRRGNTIPVDQANSRKEIPTEQSIGGMEMFTMPQTLTNPTPLQEGSRYVPVLDPFRPLATIEGVTIEQRPTYGLMSHKTANLSLTVHDRSRLHELADLLKPLVYSQTTVWLTYGWRHPVEHNNPYANFINGKMLVREPYGIVNSSFEFDAVGQVKLNVQLYTRGVRELRDIRITDVKNSYKDLEKQIKRIADKIQTYRKTLKIDKPTGVLKEIRAVQVLEAASNGIFPDIDPKEVSEIISKIDKSFIGQELPISQLRELKTLLQNLYSVEGSKEKKFSFKERENNVADAAVKKLFEEVRSGPDVFLMTEQKNDARQNQIKTEQHPYVELVKSYNRTILRSKENRTNKNFRKLVSFGKLFTTFMTNAATTIDGIDELQMFFYPFNEKAGRSAGVNIAEFPIDMSIFLDQYKDHISKRKSDRITVEEFLKLVIDAQLQDPRGPGYGFFTYFEHYNPNNTLPALKKKEASKYENDIARQGDKLGPFKMPQIDVYVESLYVTPSGNGQNDLLETFNNRQVELTGNSDANYTKVLKIHVFDKTIDPYPMAGAIFRADDGTGFPPYERVLEKFKANIEKSIRNLDQELQITTGKKLTFNEKFGVQIEDNSANDTIKKLVSLTIPTILYGNNASNVKNFSISSKQDPLLTATHLLSGKAGRPSLTQPNGGGTMGLPLRIIPAQASMNTMGCPTLRFAQMYFCDLGCGTTISNRYGITTLTHNITPGNFESKATLSYYDAYGQYESDPTLLQYIADIDLDDIDENS